MSSNTSRTEYLDERVLELLLKGKSCRELSDELAVSSSEILDSIRRLMKACPETQRSKTFDQEVN